MIDFRNVNTLWASVLVETLSNCGVTVAIICPGSRSTSLAVAFANHPQIEAISILDERSAAFFALGRAKKTGFPPALVCTSGTAGANFYPAVIEAKESGVPLIVMTADRPPELRHCHAGQTIDQIKLYGNIPNWQCELALPQADISMLRYLRQNMVHAWERSLFPNPGVVHLNLPFREPLAPTKQSELTQFATTFPSSNFFAVTSVSLPINNHCFSLPWAAWQKKSGIIIAGLAQPHNPLVYCQAIAKISKLLFFPVLAEALSPIRNYSALNPYLVSTYDSILHLESASSDIIPEVVIQIGELPTSKKLRHWLDVHNIERWIIEPKIENFDPLHGKTIHVHSSVEKLVDSLDFSLENFAKSAYCQKWLKLEKATRNDMDQALESLEIMYEGKIAWLLSRQLPPKMPIFLANSMTVRNAEYFWQPNDREIAPYFNRGANGIDGTLSTALGIAYGAKGILLTGDLALLHDSNGFLSRPRFQGHLTIILVNNNGGGIFGMLPIAEFNSFEEYFSTPQSVNFAKLCEAYNVEHQQVDSWQQLAELVSDLPNTGIRVLEIVCDRTHDAAWLKNNLGKFGDSKD